MTDASLKKLLLTGLTLVLVVAGATVAFGVVGDDGNTSTTPTTTAEDVSGPCDEAEHANDPRCNGTEPRDDNGGRGRDHAEDDGADDDEPGDDDAGEDISGPCDEAEHADDPECTGGGTVPPPTGEIDNSGPGSVNSGPGSINSGPGSVGDDDDSSGPGPGGDDDSDDGGSSGPGGGDDDSSGPGSGGDDD